MLKQLMADIAEAKAKNIPTIICCATPQQLRLVVKRGARTIQYPVYYCHSEQQDYYRLAGAECAHLILVDTFRSSEAGRYLMTRLRQHSTLKQPLRISLYTL